VPENSEPTAGARVKSPSPDWVTEVLAPEPAEKSATVVSLNCPVGTVKLAAASPAGGLVAELPAKSADVTR
jgi:hypothetical protein